MTTFTMEGQVIKATHTLTFSADGNIVAFSADGSDPIMVSKFGKLKNPFPTAAYEEIIAKIDLKEGSTFSFTAIMDGTGDVIGEKKFVVDSKVKWKNPITHKEHELLKIVEYTGDEAERYFLVDTDRKIHMAHWRGPHSVLVTSREMALDGLNRE